MLCCFVINNKATFNFPLGLAITTCCIVSWCKASQRNLYFVNLINRKLKISSSRFHGNWKSFPFHSSSPRPTTIRHLQLKVSKKIVNKYLSLSTRERFQKCNLVVNRLCSVYRDYSPACLTRFSTARERGTAALEMNAREISRRARTLRYAALLSRRKNHRINAVWRQNARRNRKPF